MNPFSIFRILRMLVVVLVFTGVGFLMFILMIYDEVARLYRFQQRYGVDWHSKFEEFHGPVSVAYKRIGLGVIGLVVMTGLVVWLYRSLRANPAGRSRRRRDPARQSESPISRTVRYRRNALVGNYFGLAGIAAGLLLVLVDWGLFQDHDSEAALGVAVFLAGYGGVIYGCWWWLKAKGWNQAVVFIGLLPLVILCVPYVQAIFVIVPELLPLLMVMMPLILFVVVFALPNHAKPSR